MEGTFPFPSPAWIPSLEAQNFYWTFEYSTDTSCARCWKRASMEQLQGPMLLTISGWVDSYWKRNTIPPRQGWSRVQRSSAHQYCWLLVRGLFPKLNPSHLSNESHNRKEPSRARHPFSCSTPSLTGGIRVPDLCPTIYVVTGCNFSPVSRDLKTPLRQHATKKTSFPLSLPWLRSFFHLL